MKVLLINSCCGVGSTGRICTELAKDFEYDGDTVKIAYGRGISVSENCQEYAVKIGNWGDLCLHGLTTRMFDTHGLGSKNATKKFLKWTEEYNPDLLWLHNIHGYYINYELLFKWIKQHNKMKVYWTLHSCWAFTGHCSYFTAVKCEQWKTHCSYCPQKRSYPASFFKDNCYNNFTRKRRAFTGVSNMTLITPSQWLADLVEQSFLKAYPIEVRRNTINQTVFKPTSSDFRERFALQNKKIVLGVANPWNKRKGLEDFIKLAVMLDDSYSIVLVGLTAKQIARMPKRIIGLKKTDSPTELAAIYTAADVFVNPTKEDNYPTVNLEAEACGTPVVTYDTGGCKETIKNVISCVVPCGDIDALKRACQMACEGLQY